MESDRTTLVLDDTAVTPAVSSRAMVGLFAVVLLHVVLAWLFRLPGFAWGEDDAGYFLLAQDLTHFGYRELQDVEAPVHARFPPGFPLLLAMAGPLVGWRLDPLVAVVILTSAAALVFFFDATRRVVGVEVALLTALLFAVSPLGLRDAGMLMAEAPFKLFTAIGLWGVTREHEHSRFALVAGIAVIAAALTRTAGVVLIAALFVHWILSRRWRHAVYLAMGASATVGLWLFWTLVAPEPENRRLYVADLGIRRDGRENKPVVAQMVERVGPRLKQLVTRYFSLVLAVPALPATRIDNVAWVVTFLGAGGAAVILLWRRWRAFVLFLLSYVALLTIWRWAQPRFATPIAWFLFVVVLAGVGMVAGRFVGGRMRRPALLLVTALFLAGAAQRNVDLHAGRLACDRSNPAASASCLPEEERIFLTMAHWVRDSTPREAILFVSKERAFHVHTGRLTINQDRALQEDSLSLGPYLRGRGVSYTVVGPIGVRQAQHARLLARACRDLVLVREYPLQSAILRIRGAEEAVDDRSCPYLAPWRQVRQVYD